VSRGRGGGYHARHRNNKGGKCPKKEGRFSTRRESAPEKGDYSARGGEEKKKKAQGGGLVREWEQEERVWERGMAVIRGIPSWKGKGNWFFKRRDFWRLRKK